jgi:hypothetical protein
MAFYLPSSAQEVSFLSADFCLFALLDIHSVEPVVGANVLGARRSTLSLC